MTEKKDVFGAIGGVAFFAAFCIQVAFWGGTIDPRGSHQLFAGLCGGYLFGYWGAGAIHLFVNFVRKGFRTAARETWGFIVDGDFGGICINIFVLLILVVLMIAIIVGPIIGDPAKIVLVGILIGNVGVSEFTIPLLETRSDRRLHDLRDKDKVLQIELPNK